MGSTVFLIFKVIKVILISKLCSINPNYAPRNIITNLFNILTEHYYIYENLPNISYQLLFVYFF